jgi:hypothetical protein
MTEEQARAALRACGLIGGLGEWIADQPWREVGAGWLVTGDPDGLRFALEKGSGRLRVTALLAGGQSTATWTVEG